MIPYSSDEIKMLEEGVKNIWLCFHQMQEFEENPVIIYEGEGIKVRGIDGKEYIDGISGAVVTGIGYSNQNVKEAMKKQIDELCWWPMLHATNPPAVKLAVKLAELLPGNLNHAFLLSGGSEATECAMKMARQYHIQTGNPLKAKVVSRYMAYHGSTKGGQSASGVGGGLRFDPLLAGYIHVFPPYCYRCPYGQDVEECNFECAQAVESAIRLEGRQTVSAVIIDPIMSAGGIIVPPKEYHQRIRDVCDRTDVLLIFDEVLTGFGRTGHLFACNYYDVVPDIMCLGKGMSGGYQPLAATVATEEISQAFRGKASDGVAFAHGNTYGGHPIPSAAGLAAIEELFRLDLVENSKNMGLYLMAKCRQLQDKYSIIGDVRGLGLLLGMEMVQDRATKKMFRSQNAVVPKLREKAMERGLITRGSPHVWHLCPPLIVTQDEIDEIIDIVDDCLQELIQEL
jgi:adenosylmethionine-8-amino-7-oxononanoate aminotransferase